jgi:hypothetical protein
MSSRSRSPRRGTLDWFFSGRKVSVSIVLCSLSDVRKRRDDRERSRSRDKDRRRDRDVDRDRVRDRKRERDQGRDRGRDRRRGLTALALF